jgi:hypothetical protein
MARFKRSLPILAVVVVIGLVSVSGFLYYKYQQAQQEILGIKTGSSDLSAENKRLVAEVSKFIVLPDEEPTIATVSDVDKLKDQPFFQKAKNGDKVLIYSSAKKAYLYDPNLKKILDVANFNVSSPSAQQTTNLPQKEDIKVVVRNGTNIQGLATKMSKQVQDILPGATISKENAAKFDYDKSTIVILSDYAKDSANKLSQSLGIAIGNLPPGEVKPEGSDIIVIFGQDKGR